MSLILILLAAATVVLCTSIWLSALALLRPPRMSAGKALYLLKRLLPSDLGMKFEPVSFAVANKVTLAGWWMPHPAAGSRTVILVHGYADAKVGALAWAPLWRRLGFNILAYDQRAHGESGGRYCTGGILETEDLLQVIDQLSASRPAACKKIVLFGISLGAAPSLAVSAIREGVAAAVLDCPFYDFSTAVAGLSENLKLPVPGLLPVVLKVAGWISKANLTSINTPQLIKSRKCPVMVIQSEVDIFVPPDRAQEIASAVRAQNDGSEIWEPTGSTHLHALRNEPDEYESRLRRFLSQTVFPSDETF